MNITFCNLAFAENTYGPLYHFPMGLLNIVTITKQQSTHNVSIVDIPWLIYRSEESKDFLTYTVKKILEKSPDVIAFYTRCDILPSIILVSKEIKKIKKELKIIYGGPGATFVAEEILNCFKFVDLIVLGEGEVTAAQLCKVEGEEDLRKIDGIIYNDSNGTVVKTKERELICDLNDVPLPDYNLIDYYKNTSQVASLEAGRGCPYQCTFCSTSNFWRRKYRVKSPDKIVEEMKRLYQDFGVKSVTLIHDNLIVSHEFVRELTSKIKEKLPGIKWRCSGRIDNLSKDVVDQLKESGCESLYLGIETGSPTMQKIINKNLEISNFDDILSYCEEKGLNTWASFIIGFPQERIEDIDATLKLATKIRQYKNNQVVQIHVLALEPGSQLFQEYKDKIVFTNSISDHSQFIYDKDNVEYSDLIKDHPNVFSSFFALKHDLLDVDMNAFSRCVSIFLELYPKTLEILFDVFQVSPTEFFSYYTKNCVHSSKCDSKRFQLLSCKLCNNIDSFLNYAKINLSAPYQEVLKYEVECWKLLNEEYHVREKQKLLTEIKEFKVSNQIRLFVLEVDPFSVMKAIRSKKNIQLCEKAFLILVRQSLESVKTVSVNEATFHVIKELSLYNCFTLKEVEDFVGGDRCDAVRFLDILYKNGILEEERSNGTII